MSTYSFSKISFSSHEILARALFSVRRGIHLCCALSITRALGRPRASLVLITAVLCASRIWGDILALLRPARGLQLFFSQLSIALSGVETGFCAGIRCAGRHFFGIPFFWGEEVDWLYTLPRGSFREYSLSAPAAATSLHLNIFLRFLIYSLGRRHAIRKSTLRDKPLLVIRN